VTNDVDMPRLGRWQLATIVHIQPETTLVKTFRLSLREPSPHLAGQHFLVRLTAADGSRAQRSYSIASPPSDGTEIELTVERLPNGEVSGYLHDELAIGDTIEVRGPIGGWFIWDGSTPALFVGGGSGIVPLMAMLRLARRTSEALAHLVVSVRAPDDLIYADEVRGRDTTVIYSRHAPDGARPAGRLTVADLAPLVRADATTYVCGSTRFAEAASDLLLGAGVAAETIRVERFGPTG
jgi:ferredoxin-NADP reductase